MTTTRRTMVNAGAASLVAMAAVRTAQVETLAQAGTPTPQPGTAGADPAAIEPVLRADIDLIAAQEAALGGQPQVAVHSVKLQRASGTLRYEVELSNGAEVFVDATTGQVMPMTEQSSDDDGGDEEDEDEEDEED